MSSSTDTLQTGPNRPAPAPNFNRLAGIYRWMEWFSFGPWLWWCRSAFLDKLGGCRQALVIGDGDGRFTARLLRANSALTVDAVDASAAMLQALRQRAGSHARRVRTQCIDARAWRPAERRYDLVVTHFFLDCLSTEEVHALAATVRSAIPPDALWVVSEFAVPKGWFGKLVAKPVVAGLYWAFALLTGLAQRRLPRHAAALRAAGFALRSSRTWLGGLLVSELWAAE